MDYAGLNTPASNASYILDLSITPPAWRATSTSMTQPRVMGNAILLPTKQVMIVNGAGTGMIAFHKANFPSCSNFKGDIGRFKHLERPLDCSW